MLKKRLLLFIMLLLILTGCGQKVNNNTGSNRNGDSAKGTASAKESGGEGFQFEYNGVTIPLNVDATPVIETLGEPLDTFEAPSCAFQGLDKIFYYNGFEITTYPKEDKDYISTVNILDDSVSTKKGISLGSEPEDVASAYGKYDTGKEGSYTYTQGETKLTFIIENGTVAGITYYAIVEGLNN